jgi:hypothetical protein
MFELTIDRSRNRDRTSGFHINVAEHEHEFLNSEMENTLTNCRKKEKKKLTFACCQLEKVKFNTLSASHGNS